MNDTYKLQVVILDEGIGMSDSDLKNVFTPFFRSSSQENRDANPGGHGLGLNICKLLAERLGGSIEIQSQLGFGT